MSFGWAKLNESLTVKPHPIPKLELLEDMVARARHYGFPPLLGVAIIAAQHKLETTATLFKAIIDLGVEPGNIFLSGKVYSTSKAVEKSIQQLGVRVFSDAIPKFPGDYQRACADWIKQIWDSFMQHVDKSNGAIKKIVILDDGGRVIELMPHYVPFFYAVAAIEQTREGLYSKAISNIVCRLIAVATCAVKIFIEPPLIAEAILKRLHSALDSLKMNERTICGVVGSNDVIGSTIVNYLLLKGYYVLICDENPKSFVKIEKHVFRVEKITHIFVNAECIFGCTGRDITAGLQLEDLVRRDQTWISCTSEDKEFRSFLIENKHRAQFSELLGDVTFTTNLYAKIIVKSWGCPFNFDQQPWNVPAEDIEVTQACLLGSMMQASLTASTPVRDGITINRSVMCSLNPELQRFIALSWGNRESNLKRYSLGFFDRFKDREWVRQHSGGEYDEKSKVLERCFENPMPLSSLPAGTTPIRSKL